MSLLNSTSTGFDGGPAFELCPHQEGLQLGLDTPLRVTCKKQGFRYLPTMQVTVRRNSACGSVFIITPRQILTGKSPALLCDNTHWSTRERSAPNYVLQMIEELLGCPFTDWAKVYEDFPSLRTQPRPIAISSYFKLAIYQSAKKTSIFDSAKNAYKSCGYSTIVLCVSSRKEEICNALFGGLLLVGLEPKLSQRDLLEYMKNRGDECLFLEEREPFGAG